MNVAIGLSLADAQALYDHTGEMEFDRHSWSNRVRASLSEALHFAATDGETAVNAETIECPRCEGQTFDVGSCGLCGNLGILSAGGERLTIGECLTCGHQQPIVVFHRDHPGVGLCSGCMRLTLANVGPCSSERGCRCG